MRAPLTVWSRRHLQLLVDDPSSYAPVIEGGALDRMLPGLDLWDLWPLRHEDGSLATPCGWEVWAALSAPAEGDPGRRHHLARIRLVGRPVGSLEGSRAWSDLGPLFPDGATPGSREWAGSCTLVDGSLHAFYTAAGERGEVTPTFRQRIMGATGRLDCGPGRPVFGSWSAHRELVAADGDRYQRAEELVGEPGFIKAFRDPFRFADPSTGTVHLLFTASLGRATSPFNGAIGVARRASNDDDAAWELLDPLVGADGVNNELERPHVVVHDDRYYLFFSTQQRTFHPGVDGPTGLYGFCGPTLLGPYEALNGSGLVLRNPPSEPHQAYSWLVLDDLRVASFVDAHSLAGRHPDHVADEGPQALRRHFGGTMAPLLRIELDGTRAGLAPQP